MKMTTRNASPENSLKNTKIAGIDVLVIFVLTATLGGVWNVRAQTQGTVYPSMAALDQYLMERNSEITLARSAAPPAISSDADVLVLGRQGYNPAAKGKNGFVCMVERSWTAGIDDPEFWNPKLRGPICLNPAAARSYLPITLKKTELVIGRRSKAEMVASIKAAFSKKELPTPEPGAMSYMLSKQQYLGDHDRRWHPHLMFFVPQTEALSWGADLAGSPIMAFDDTLDRLTVFMIPVGKWSDGTPDPPM